MLNKLYVGQKVVCVENAFDHWRSYNFFVPAKDEIYTVRELKYFNEVHYRGYAIKLQEVKNPVYHFPNMTDEVSFRVKFFIPLEEYINEETLKKIDITSLVKSITYQEV
ncbi:MAG TPA: hypothetical protein VFF33_05025 [Ignavibacteriaceae bacterium]|nr:hypothetical protein [Ignavibacteriaceae bacterium]